jgi:hypothetical protein
MLNSKKTISLAVIPILFSTAVFITCTKSSSNKTEPKAEYSALILTGKKKLSATEGSRVKIQFSIKNTGTDPWHSKDKHPCLFSYHLQKINGETIQYDNRRFTLPGKVIPGQNIDLPIILRIPIKAGDYILEFDMLREGAAWFKDYGSKTAKISLHVKEIKWPDEENKTGLEYGKYTHFSSSVEEINQLYKLIRLTLEQNEVEFKGRSGRVYGFSPGKDYPQIWLRDANTIIPASQYFYDLPYLSSWMEEHLYFQEENGALQDWINAAGQSDKNTTETDQEASAVQSAFQLYQLIGSDWLGKKVKGQRIIDRLEAALYYVLHNRFNKELGLTIGAHTADWGDVDLIDKDQEAVYVDEKTHWTADIYDQAMFFKACKELAEIFSSLNEKDKTEYWRKQADSIRQNTNELLWQEKKGFYKIHIHLDSIQHNFDENDIFALGGNTIAVLSGLADDKKCRKIITTALQRQKQFGVSTISGTLLPPYPENFFPHPLLDTPYKYQNGAQWDWFGGRMVYAMFEYGDSFKAQEKLLEIIKKNIANKGFFEWDDRKGTSRGSDIYCGNAGSMSKAVIEGYFGIKLKKDSLSIEPKLGTDSGKIHIYQPVNDIFAASEYIFDSEKSIITLKYNSNFSGKGSVKILIPRSLTRDYNKLKDTIKLYIDGQQHAFQIKSKHIDVLIEFQTDFKHRTAEISFSSHLPIE